MVGITVADLPDPDKPRSNIYAFLGLLLFLIDVAAASSPGCSGNPLDVLNICSFVEGKSIQE